MAEVYKVSGRQKLLALFPHKLLQLNRMKLGVVMRCGDEAVQIEYPDTTFKQDVLFQGK